ncbi:MAG: metallophosphoesterase family protein [Nitrospira sp.]
MSASRTFRIGVLADTHGLFDAVLEQHFRRVDHIVHAGDIGGQSVIEQLKTIAPVTAVSGNVDEYERSGFPRETVIELAGIRIAIRHILYEGGKLTKEGRAFLDRTHPDICIFGHTHQPRNERLGETLLFNPGSAGPRRFTLPRMIGTISIGDRLLAKHIVLRDIVT